MAGWRDIESYICYTRSGRDVSEDIAAIIRNKADINRCSSDPFFSSNLSEKTPLELAIITKREDIFAELIHQKADINIKTPDNRSSLLELTAQNGLKRCMELLLCRKADPNENGCFRQTPLFWSILYGAPDMVRMLLKSGADHTKVNFDLLEDNTRGQTECLSIVKEITTKQLRRQWSQVLLRQKRVFRLFELYPGLLRYLGTRLLLLC